MSYVYIQSKKSNECPPNGLYTVGFYDPNGKWTPESDYNDKDRAAVRVAFLNGAEDTEADGFVFCGRCGKLK